MQKSDCKRYVSGSVNLAITIFRKGRSIFNWQDWVRQIVLKISVQSSKKETKALLDKNEVYLFY